MFKDSYDFVSRAIDKISLEKEFISKKRTFWVCYGSFILNLQNEKSDLDLLYVHSETNQPSRVESHYEAHPITIYSISSGDFVDDGNKKRFGGYFSGKVLNPYVIFSKKEENINLLLKTAGEFIADFAADIGSRRISKISTPANLVADTILARFQLCPWYANYFTRYYTHPDFAKLWKRMEEIIPYSLVIAKKVIPNKNGFIYINQSDKDVIHADLVKSIARFWSVGNCFHGSPYFLDNYIEKSKQYSGGKKKLKQMISFIEEKAGLSSI